MGGKDMKYLVLALVLVMATSAFGLEKKAYQMRDDFGTDPLYDGAVQYYYYIPCPTYSWFWAYSGWDPGDIVGAYFTVGDVSMGGWDVLDPFNCQHLEQVRILDFAGYGTVYPGLFTVEMNVWCPPCPLYLLGGTGPFETHYAWNYIPIDISVCDCFDGQGLTFAVTLHMIGTDAAYPAVGMDNISTAIEFACDMHDLGCLPAVFPRAQVNSGYFGNGDPCAYAAYDPPYAMFADGRDTTPDASMYGFIECAWRAYMVCSGPTATDPSTWGNIKAMYK
jgi:hypothetical protein